MNTTIKHITTAILLTVSITAIGQQTVTPTTADKAKVEASGLKKKFSLTDVQTTQCEAIIKKYADQMSATKTTSDTVKYNNSMKQLADKRNKEIKDLLTTAQSAKFDTWEQKKQLHNGKAMAKDSVSVK